jgi:hypothetical protein
LHPAERQIVMPLFSRLFRTDTRLLAVAQKNSEHITLKRPRERGPHVHKIQQALFRLGFTIDRAETNVNEYGQSTADAVLAYKSDPRRNIINPAYQSKPDNIVGRLTVAALDQEIHIQERENGFSPDIKLLGAPPYEAQIRANSCWAACLVMWRRAQQASSFTQEAYINSAPNLQVGPGGIDISGLETVISDDNSIALTKMETLKIERKEDVPNVRKLLSREDGNGHIFLAFQRAGGGGGHAHVLFGYAFLDFNDGLVFDALDPDPAVGRTRTTMGSYFSKFPALAGFRQG